MSQKTVLHVGCGSEYILNTHGFDSANWRELRLDIDDSFNPDIVGDMLDMKDIKDCSVDAIFSSHNIEHLYANDVPIALKEFLRVLRPDGYLVLTCPDLKSACTAIAQDKSDEPLYYTSSGQAITPLDIIYGYHNYATSDNPYMLHKCGFTSKTLMQCLLSVGFANAAVASFSKSFALYSIATKQKQGNETLKRLFNQHWIR